MRIIAEKLGAIGRIDVQQRIAVEGACAFRAGWYRLL